MAEGPTYRFADFDAVAHVRLGNELDGEAYSYWMARVEVERYDNLASVTSDPDRAAAYAAQRDAAAASAAEYKTRVDALRIRLDRTAADDDQRRQNIMRSALVEAETNHAGNAAIIEYLASVNTNGDQDDRIAAMQREQTQVEARLHALNTLWEREDSTSASGAAAQSGA